MSTDDASIDSRRHVVVVGGGFGGARAVAHLARSTSVRVTLIDKRNFQQFAPLTYQVATGALSPGDICYPLRALFRAHRNVSVLMAEVTGFDLDNRRVLLANVDGVHDTPDAIEYDALVVAGGSDYAYYGHDEWRQYAKEVKTLESALSIRSELLTAFEQAEIQGRGREVGAELTFVVVGAGPTGVEISGQIAELARDTMRHDFRRIDPTQARVILLDAGERVLAAFPQSLSRKAQRALEHLGVTVLTGREVTAVDADGVTVRVNGSTERIESKTVIWAAGVTASPLATKLAEAVGEQPDKAGRLTVGPELTLTGHPEVVALGDMVSVRREDGTVDVLPGLAPVAIQQGAYAGRTVVERLQGQEVSAFHYHDKGNVATIGRSKAVVDLHGFHLSGLPAWLVWVGVHLWYLIGGRNRLLVLVQWASSFVTHGRGARLITRQGTPGG